MQIPQRHLSVRVPWHDRGWNGQICKDPQGNASCMYLPRVQAKNIDFEEENNNKWLHEIDDESLPPCIDEKVNFLSPHEVIKMKYHPYAEFEDIYKHYINTPYKIPGFSFSVIPYGWMLKDKKTKQCDMAESLGIPYDPTKEPVLSFEDQWVQHIDNQKTLLDSFASAIIPGETLIFIYAKNIPLIDRVDRVLIGVTSVSSVGELTEYLYNTKKPPMRSVLWERPVFHSFKGENPEGIILPYSEIIEKLCDESTEEVEKYIAFAPSFLEFSYGSELVKHDTAIDAIISIRNALIQITSLLKNRDEYERQLSWLNAQLGRLWNMRGAFPGLGSVLTAMNVPEGAVIAWEIEKYLRQNDGEVPVTNPWKIVEEIFFGNALWLREDLSKKIGTTFKGVWEKLPKERKEYLHLLSRLAMDSDQAKYFYEPDKPAQYLCNPYLFYEESILSENPINLEIVDKVMYMPDNLAEKFPLPETARPDGVLDKRRIRSYVIDILENAANRGHSLLTSSQVITEINEWDMDKPLQLTNDILNYVEEFFVENGVNKIIVVPPDVENPCKFYKLSRYNHYRELIAGTVKIRCKGIPLKIEADWRVKIEDAFKPIDINAPQWRIEKEQRARKEKAMALDMMSRSRFSVLVGPAGTGKTILLNVLCSHEDIRSKGVLKLAPTGKARVKLGADAKTIAQFLTPLDRYDGKTGRYYANPKGKNYTQARTVIIDEASMLTEDQLAAVLDAIIDYDRLILVGDPRQLPPIGTGKPFVDIVGLLKPVITACNEPITGPGYAELVEIFRQGEDPEGELQSTDERMDVRLSKWFSGMPNRKDDEDIFDEIALNSNKVWPSIKFIQWYDTHQLQEILLNEIQEEFKLDENNLEVSFDETLGGNRYGDFAYFNIESAEMVEAWQILSPVNNHGFGTRELNRAIQQLYHHRNIDLAQNPPDLNLGNFTINKLKRIPEPVGIDNMVYGDKVMNLRNTRWEKPWNFIYNPQNIQAMKYFANGEIGVIVGQFRSNANLKKHFMTPKDKRGKLYPPAVQIAFSSQPGYAYQIKTGNFTEEGDIQFELAYAITVHKSQGSGFGTVFLILPNPCSLLSRELLYTAFTRQENRIIVFHQGEFKDFKKYISDEYSETGRRLTDLFSRPSIKQVKNRYYDGKYVQISAKGEFMISKSEVIIADHLFYQTVPYVYEQPSTDSRGITIHPDFTIENRARGVTYYWEHLGMLTDTEYRKKWNRKLEWYSNMGVIDYTKATNESEKVLITTRDKPDGGIDSQEVMKIINKVIKGL